MVRLARLCLALAILMIAIALVWRTGLFPLLPMPGQGHGGLVEVARGDSSECGSLRFAREIEIVSERQSLRGKVAVYRGQCAYLWGRGHLVYGSVIIDGAGIHPGAWVKADEGPPGDLAEVSVGSACDSTRCNADALVRLLSPDIALVEVVYSNGRVDRAGPEGGFFASIGAGQVLEVRLLDATGAVLRRYPM